MIESILIGAAIITMIAVLIIAILPVIPGPPLMWVVAMAFGIGEGLLENHAIFTRFHPIAAIIATLIMIWGSTSDLWMPYFGMRSQGSSCLGTLGTLLGGLFGTFFIPIPILGTMIGAVIGAILFEVIQVRDPRQLFSIGIAAIKVFIWSYAIEYTATFLIFITFVLSIYLTR